MIRLLEHEDDIYLNSFIETVRRHIDAESFFDQEAYALLHQLIVPEIESRLINLLIGLDKRSSRQVDMAEELFRQGYEHERGIFCDQDFTKVSGYYVKAASCGIAEAWYRLGWLLENELVHRDELRSCDDYYRQAAESGNIKAIVATGQRLLFNASDQNGIRNSLEMQQPYTASVLYANRTPISSPGLDHLKAITPRLQSRAFPKHGWHWGK